MKTLSLILTLLVTAQISYARQFSQQTIWEGTNYQTSIISAEIKTQTWDYTKHPKLSSDRVIELSKAAFSKAPQNTGGYFSEISFTNYNTEEKPLWLWKVVFKNGKEGLIKTPGGTFKDKDRLIYFIDLDGKIYEPTKLPL